MRFVSMLVGCIVALTLTAGIAQALALGEENAQVSNQRTTEVNSTASNSCAATDPCLQYCTLDGSTCVSISSCSEDVADPASCLQVVISSCGPLDYDKAGWPKCILIPVHVLKPTANPLEG